MTLLYWLVSAFALVGAATVVFTKDLIRLAMGLGVFFLACAAYFAVLGFGFLALAELFVYVGGVLVLVLFAIMLLPRAQPGEPALTSRRDPLAAVTSFSFAALLVALLRSSVPAPLGGDGSTIDGLGRALLGPWLTQFELVGLLLLAALVAVVSITGGDRR
jgi:NADH:ubiquinone oxidoreductase subunit 6 (subunit J)